jgi:hypothetical protein
MIPQSDFKLAFWKMKASHPWQRFLLLSLRHAIVGSSVIFIRFGVEGIGSLVVVAGTEGEQQAK